MDALSGSTPARRTRRHLSLPFVLLTAGLTVLLSLGNAPGESMAAPAPVRKNTAPRTQSLLVRGLPLYVSTDTPAAKARATVDPSDTTTLALLGKIAAQPQSLWLGDWITVDKAKAKAASLVTAANAANAVLPIVLYDIPVRDCRSYSGGGATSGAQYRAWIDQIALGLSGGRTIVILEPDALPQMDCLTATQQADRLSLLKYAVTQLTMVPGVAVYLDAGHSEYRPASVMIDRLAKAGVSLAAGFSLNVANFKWTSTEMTYGKTLSAALGGTHFVIDTSRNGLGPYSGDLGWCNPPGRALGVKPTTTTNDTLLDAFLWIKTVGLSDGACRPGAPAAGVWWQDYALGLASRAAW